MTSSKIFLSRFLENPSLRESDFYGEERTQVLISVCEALLPKDILSLLLGYDFNFIISKKKIHLTCSHCDSDSYYRSCGYPRLLYDKKNIHLIPRDRSFTIINLENGQCREDGRFIDHDGWIPDDPKTNEPIWSKEAVSDAYGDSYRQTAKGWKINDISIALPFHIDEEKKYGDSWKDNPVIFKRKERFFVFHDDSFFYCRNQDQNEENPGWKRTLICNPLFSSLPYCRWSIFWEEILAVLYYDEETEIQTLCLYDITSDEESFLLFSLLLYQHCYPTSLLATTNTLYVLASHDSFYYHIQFGHSIS